MSVELSEVRNEDSLNIESVHEWLSTRIPDLESIPKVRQFRSGCIQPNFLLEYPGRELVLRTPPRGTKAASAHDMSREFLIQRSLKPYFSLVPNVLALCQDAEILGSDFYVMERIEGTILRRDLPSDISISPEDVTSIGKKVIEGLVELHSIDPEILANLSKGPGYVSRQVEGWSRRYRDALTDDVPKAEELIAWLREEQQKILLPASSTVIGDSTILFSTLSRRQSW
ncbi:MAG: phosphotransferase family protein [Actinomycetota bacterium]